MRLSLLSGPDWATLPLWSSILVSCHSRRMSKNHQERRPEVEGQQCMCVGGGRGAGKRSEENRGVGRLSWVPAKMVEEEVASPSLPALLLPGKWGSWRLWLFSPTVGTQMHKWSDTHSGENKTWGFIQTVSFPFGCRVRGSGGGDAEPLASRDITDWRHCL